MIFGSTIVTTSFNSAFPVRIAIILSDLDGYYFRSEVIHFRTRPLYGHGMQRIALFAS